MGGRQSIRTTTSGAVARIRGGGKKPRGRCSGAYSLLSERYIDLFGSVEHVHADGLALIRRHLGQTSGPVLDLGCGAGHLTGFPRSMHADVTGIDLVPEFITHARRDHPTARFEVGVPVRSRPSRRVRFRDSWECKRAWDHTPARRPSRPDQGRSRSGDGDVPGRVDCGRPPASRIRAGLSVALPDGSHVRVNDGLRGSRRTGLSRTTCSRVSEVVMSLGTKCPRGVGHRSGNTVVPWRVERVGFLNAAVAGRTD